MAYKILITGIAGSGKSTIIAELRRRGRVAIDLDNSGACIWVNKKTGAGTTYREGAGREWIGNHRWQVVVPRLVALLDSLPDDKNIYIGGKIPSTQVKELSGIFDLVYLLGPYDETIRERLRARTNNASNFAKSDEEIETILRNRHGFEKACLECGAYPMLNGGTAEELVERLCKNN